MSEAERELLVARTLEDFRERLSRGENPEPADYSDPLGDAFGEFLDVLEVEAALDRILEPAPEPALPREFGNYTLLKELGRGSSGIVYEAVHRELGRREAVKILRTGFDEDEIALERFRREAKTLARIHHSHIVQIYEAGQVDGSPYYAMELVEGKSLSALLRAGDVPDHRTLCRGLADVADALAELHAVGIVHRDVKPSNIVQREDGSMCLADFGLARSVDSVSMTRTGQALGTPRYMSPEQMLGRRDEIDGRTDVYGLGATIYEVVARRPVFQTEDVRALLRMVMSERATPLHKVAEHVHEDLERIVMKALEKRREDRYTSAASMRDDLRHFAEGLPVQGRPVSVLRRAARTLRRRAVPIAAAVLLATGFGLWWTHRPARLSLWSIEGAQIRVGTEVEGVTKVDASVAPGPVDVQITLDGFRPRHLRPSLGPGTSTDLRFVALSPENPLDPKAQQQLASALALDSLELEQYETNRSATSEGGAIALFPRGRVRRSDLQRIRLELTTLSTGDLFAAGDEKNQPSIVFRRGGQTIFEQHFYPVYATVDLPFPAEVLSVVEDGEEISWGAVDVEKHEVLTTFRVSDLDEHEAAAWKRIEEQGTVLDPVTRTYLACRFLIGHRLYQAAYDRALSAQAADGRNVVNLALAREALRRAGVSDGEGEPEALSNLEDELKNQPQKLVDAWLTAPPGSADRR